MEKNKDTILLEKLKIEEDELTLKINNLLKFIFGDKANTISRGNETAQFNALCETRQKQLATQLKHMSEYRVAITKRMVHILKCDGKVKPLSVPESRLN